MLFHKNCGSTLYINAAPAFRILSTFGVAQGNITMGVSDIRLSKGSFRAEFYCTECSTNVGPDDITVYCTQCTETTPVNEAYTLKKSGGIYCPRCAKMLKERGRQPTPLASSINEVKVNQEAM